MHEQTLLRAIALLRHSSSRYDFTNDSIHSLLSIDLFLSMYSLSNLALIQTYLQV